jgi:phospholipid/cholesterol/gamma-HCH transport system substrate-binding protein
MPSARQIRWAKVRVFSVSAAALVIFADLVYLLTGGTLLEEKAYVYLYIPDATGLSKGAPVRVDGVYVGKVESIALSGLTDPRRVVKVTVSVRRSTLAKIPEDSYAELSSETLVGDQFVDVTSGRSPTPLQPGGVITYKEQAEILKSLDLQQFEAALRSVDATLTDIEQGKSRVGQFILGTAVYDDLRKRIIEADHGLRAARSPTNPVGEALFTEKAYQRLMQPVRALDQALARLQSGQGTAGQLLRDTAGYEQVRAFASDLSEIAQGLRSGPLLQSDELYTDWNRQVAGWIRMVDAVNTSPLLSNSQAYDSLNGLAKEMRDSLRDFRANPKKYLRIVF